MKKTIIILLLVFLGTGLTLACFAPFFSEKTSGLMAIKIYDKTELVEKESGSILTFADTIILYQYNGYRLYQTPIYNTHFYMPKASLEDQEIEPDSMVSSIRYASYVFKSGEKQGFLLDPRFDTSFREFNYDSLINKYSSLNLNFLTPDSSKMVSCKRLNKRETIETYPGGGQSCINCADSVYIYYNDAYLKYDFISIAPAIDRSKNSKVSRMEFVLNPIEKGEYPYNIPRREFVFGFFEFTPENSNEVIALFDKVIKEKFHDQPSKKLLN